MDIHEYQAKALLGSYGVCVPQGYLATQAQDARACASKIEGSVWVVKAQIHAGGRGKGGGVRVVRSLDEVVASAESMLGMQLITHQTGPQGQRVNQVYIEQGCDIARELYVSVVLDRSVGQVMFMVSTEGGMDIEEVAVHSPEKILKIHIDPATGMMPFHARRLCFALGLEGDSFKKGMAFFLALYRAFTESDASLLEINPMVLTKQGEIMALDAKMSLDDNALFRHPDFAALRDPEEEDPREKIARDHDLSYVSLEGNIGCMVNGAGLAMATMDIIKLHGGAPANFLDVGGGANTEKVTTAFRLILSDPSVKGILVNIFGGIMRCNIIADGIIVAAREVDLNVPLVVRLEGTNVDLGKEILAQSGLPIIAADNLEDAAKKIVASVVHA